MSKFKHSKLRNTGLLFEFLLRQVTVDVLNKKKESPALKIIKSKFNEHTEIGKELALYNLIVTKKFKSDKKADFFLSEVIRQRGRLNNATLRREKYNIIASIKESYDVNQLFSSKVPNYKVFASVYKLFEGINEMGADEKTESYFIIIENVTTLKHTKNKSYVPEEFKTEELCRVAVSNNGFALVYVPGALRTEELCRIAVEDNGNVLMDVPEESRTNARSTIALHFSVRRYSEMICEIYII